MRLAINEREISPLMIWHNGENVLVNIFSLDFFSGYNFIGGGGDIYYTLSSGIEVPSGDIETTMILSKTPIATGKLRIPEELITNWGKDDLPIFNHVIERLGLSAVPA